MAKAQSGSGGPGLVVPIDIEAMCIGTDPGAIFQQVPFDFSKLANSPNAPYLSDAIAAGGLNTLPQGVHLHWALPDALTQGAQAGGSVAFPAVPDRWLVTRIFCDPDQATQPRFDRWLIESNHYSAADPNQDGRTAIAVPYQGDDWETKPFRYLGKVSKWSDGMVDSGLSAPGAENYVPGLTAVGHGQIDFAASYQNSQNILGFNDLGAELAALGKGGADRYLSYHVVGWYSNPAEDPLLQLPARIPSAQLAALSGKVGDAADKALLLASFAIAGYALIDPVPTRTGTKLWSILATAGYPLEVDIPLEIDPDQFQDLLANITDSADKALVQNSYPAVLSPVAGIDDTKQLQLWTIMAGAGYDFTGGLLRRARWALPSATPPSGGATYTLYSGFISDVRWNPATNYFKDSPASNFNIAIGNTAGEAMSALIANSAGYAPDQVAMVEEILDALQAGILPLATSKNMLNDWELLVDTLHKNAFGSERGGYIWQVQARKNSAQTAGEVSLPAPLAKQLNDLNVNQLELNRQQENIAAIRAQIYCDWYRFMWINYPQGGDPSGGIDPGNLAQYVLQKISNLKDKISGAEDLAKKVVQQHDALQQAVGDTCFLARVTAPRYWRPNEPVVLFQGDGITPSDRYGNDGRYMADDTLVCRLTGQLLTSLTIPAGAFGNTAAVTLGASAGSPIPNPNGQPLLDGINAAVADAALLNEDVIGAQLRVAGVSTTLDKLATAIGAQIDAFVSPAVPQTIEPDAFTAMVAAIAPDDVVFLDTWYELQEQQDGHKAYVLKNTPAGKDVLRLTYILVSAGHNPANATLDYTGLPLSAVGMQAWDGNPWLPFSLRWSVNFYPFQEVPTTQNPNLTYSPDFITSNFKFGGSDLEYSGSSFSPATQGLQGYSNTIFLTPHAGINLRKQLASFIAAHPKDPLMDELNLILDKLADKPVLSQAMSGFNEALLMRQKELQLPVADPNNSLFYDFTNTDVHDAAGDYTTERPAPDNSYNPVRVGLMTIASVTVVDVFGRNVQVQAPSLVIRAQSMQQTTLTPATDIFLPPRLTQPARLLFRWLSAQDDTVETNTHPATTPICGWVLANHLDNSLWIYDSKGNAYGALVLNWDSSRVLWQCAPGSIYFGLDAPSFFKKVPVANQHLADFVLGLYGTGDQAAAAYLHAFMRALDQASTTIEPANYAQSQANAVLLGRPLALVRASLDLEVMGGPAYSQSWQDLSQQVNAYNNDNDFSWGNEYGYSSVKFPVKIGNVPQTSDGLFGYFKDGDYRTFYAPAANTGNAHVIPPADDNLAVDCADTGPLMISMLVDPRAMIHATTGILPVKTIDLPPDFYADALEKLSLAFLAAPLLSSKQQLAMPLPAQQGGSWTWVENHGDAWSEAQRIAAVVCDAALNYAPQHLLEGWLNLSNVLLSAASFKLFNNKAGTPTLYITNDAALNAATFTFVNQTNAPLNLGGGDPVAQSYLEGGSSFAFNFGSILPDSALAGIQVAASGWSTQYFAATDTMPALWSAAPDKDMTLAPGASVSFTLQNITCPPGTVAGNFHIYYFGLPTIPDSRAPLLLPVAVQAVTIHQD